MSIPNKFDKLGNIIVQSEQPLTLTAKSTNCKVKITTEGSPTISGLKYRTSNKDNWQKYTINKEITLTNVNDYVQFKNTETTLSKSWYTDCVHFTMTGKIEGCGNLHAMLSYSSTYHEFCYCMLFKGCTSLIKAPDIAGGTNYQWSCFDKMFYGCTNLLTAPIIRNPSNVSDTSHLKWMFKNCSSLTQLNVYFTNWNTLDTDNWVDGVATGGVFFKPSSLPNTRGVSNIPTNWLVINR